MKRLAAYFRQVNTWTAIAGLALLGWLIDSLFWFLETHPLTVAGLVAYLSHAWYAFPLLGAIVGILFLRQPSRLLSLTVYDEQGAPIYRQGDFRLDEALLVPLFTSFQRASQNQRLHCFELPTGPTIYFLRQGGLTLIAAFSGTIRPAQLEAGLRSMQRTGTPTENVLRDLPLEVAALAASLLDAPVERDLLAHLWDYPQTAMTAVDLAGRLGCEEDEIIAALDNLVNLSLIQRQQVYDWSFYRLTNNETHLAHLDQFITWRGDWLSRARRVEQLIGSTKRNKSMSIK